MKCINKLLSVCIAALLCMINLTGCTAFTYSSKYSMNDSPSYTKDFYFPTFASNLCVVNTDILSDITLSDSASVGLFDLNKRETLFAQNVNMRVHPASLTKVMTALVALKYGSLDQVLIAGPEVNITESGAQKINLKEGDRMTLDQALRILLIYSANDVANMIASNIASSLDEFIAMMNEEAVRIGATNSHFVNANGLTADEHYVTAYDMYVIFNAAIKYDTFTEIINMTEYSTTYSSADGSTQEVSVKNTNAYLRGEREVPMGVTVIGGKTGTTAAAGHCLILLARDISGNPYIAVVMRSIDSETLYKDMSALLNEIVN